MAERKQESFQQYITTEKATKTMENQYFIFGSPLAKVYQEKGIEEVINLVKDGETDFELECFTAITTPLEVLISYNGYNDFSLISKQEYTLIKEAQQVS